MDCLPLLRPDAGVQVSEQSGHLLLGEPAGEGRHHSLAAEHGALHVDVGGRSATGQRGTCKDVMQVGRSFLERQVVKLVAVRAALVVETLPFCLLRCKRWRGVAAGTQNSKTGAGDEPKD